MKRLYKEGELDKIIPACDEIIEKNADSGDVRLARLMRATFYIFMKQPVSLLTLVASFAHFASIVSRLI